MYNTHRIRCKFNLRTFYFYNDFVSIVRRGHSTGVGVRKCYVTTFVTSRRQILSTCVCEEFQFIKNVINGLYLEMNVYV